MKPSEETRARVWANVFKELSGDVFSIKIIQSQMAGICLNNNVERILEESVVA
jgi:hypothetical protein